AALADALGDENLQHVGAVGFDLTHVVADLVRRKFRVGKRPQSSENPRTGNYAAVDGIAQRFVLRRSEALNGREAGEQRFPGISFGSKRGLGWSLSLIF